MIVLIPILLSLIGGAIIPLFHFQDRKKRQLYIMFVVCLTAIATFFVILNRPEEAFTVVHLTDKLSISFRMDGLGMVFAGLISVLWPLASLYAFEYMKHEGGENTFFTFYTMTYGITLGISFASNLMTLYMFYELLTLITLPLVMHGMKKKAVKAGRIYMAYSIAGAAFAFIGFIMILTFGSSIDFVYGGVLNTLLATDKKNLLLFVYVLAALGFGVKAAIFPFHGWLPTASVAPTPVTALLHAVAVVKAGAFAIMRITYFSFGTEFLSGTWAQYTVMAFALVTILFGSTMAVKEKHLKRRLAYSTVSNLSYVIFGAVIMTPEGLTGGLTHMVFHAIMKITLFYCAGAILYKTEKEYVSEIHGIGRSMPVIMGCFTVAALAMVGIPPLAGFVSKWNLAYAAVESNHPLALAGVGVLLVSAILTAGYLLSVVIKAYFSGKIVREELAVENTDPNKLMTVPMILLCIAIVLLGLFSAPLVNFLADVANGLI